MKNNDAEMRIYIWKNACRVIKSCASLEWPFVLSKYENIQEVRIGLIKNKVIM